MSVDYHIVYMSVISFAVAVPVLVAGPLWLGLLLLGVGAILPSLFVASRVIIKYDEPLKNRLYDELVVVLIGGTMGGVTLLIRLVGSLIRASASAPGVS